MLGFSLDASEQKGINSSPQGDPSQLLKTYTGHFIMTQGKKCCGGFKVLGAQGKGLSV